MPKPIDIKDLGIAKLKKQLQIMAKTSITFGYQGPSGAAIHPATKGKNPVSVARVAAWQEFGTKKAPARPLGRTTMEDNKKLFTTANKRALSDVIDGRAEPEEAMAVVGAVTVAALRKTISRSREWAQANTDSTVANKGHSHPLIGSDQKLTTNAAWAIRRGGRIIAQGGHE
jgi:hypothetical protein